MLVFVAKHDMTENIEIRKVQGYSGERSFTIVLPKVFAEKMGIAKGNFLKVSLEGNKLIVEKADV